MQHLQFDYRNTCALINFSHTSCCADKDEALYISEKIKNKINNIQTNHLENLIKIQLGTKKNPFFQFSDLIDFPILSLEDLQDEIFFGSYYIKQSRSYFSFYSSINQTSINILTTSLTRYKIIAMLLTSRHMRSLKRVDESTDESTDDNELISEKEINRYRIKYKIFIE